MRMDRVVFDIETDGLLDTVTTAHCAVLRSIDTGEELSFVGVDEVRRALYYLRDAQLLVGHNIIGFDIPVLQKLFPGFNPGGELIDTLVLSRMIYPELKQEDFSRSARDASFPKTMIGRHSLEAWGHRLQDFKGEFGKTADWKEFSPEMLVYCRQDVALTEHLFGHLFARAMPGESVNIEMRAAKILFEQEKCGIRFDVEGAKSLLLKLYHRRFALEAELAAMFPPWEISLGEFVPKRSNATKGYVKGVPIKRTATVTFNPGSRDHIGNRLVQLFGWKPDAFGGNGKPTVDEATLEDLPYPCIPTLIEYLTVDKRIGQLGEGSQAWLKVERRGRIHGTVHPTGAVTSRCSHSHPNMSQVPKVGNPYGEECRALFVADDEHTVLVGADASGLELRMLAHYLARYDDGAYAREVIEGDVHSLTMQALGIESRDTAKTFIYAFLYGAGNAKLAAILSCTERRAGELKAQFIAKIAGLSRLKLAVSGAVARGYLLLPDGRKARVRSQHSALNTLLQGSGAVVMKWAFVAYYEEIARRQLPARPALFSHDEMQTNAAESCANEVGMLAVDCIRGSGEHYALRCPLDAKYRIGGTWAQTH